MHGLIGRITALSGKRDELIACLLGGSEDLPGCLSYVVATDPENEDVVWVTEVWTDRESHEASLSLPAVRDAITEGRPLIASFDRHIVTVPVGGVGLSPDG